MFAPIRERLDLFEQVRVNAETQTIESPGEVDLDSEVLYRFEPASGTRITRRTVRDRSPTYLPRTTSTTLSLVVDRKAGAGQGCGADGFASCGRMGCAMSRGRVGRGR